MRATVVEVCDVQRTDYRELDKVRSGALSDLPAHRRELERLVALLGVHTVVDDTLLSFTSIRGADDLDNIATYPSGTRLPQPAPTVDRRWLYILAISILAILTLFGLTTFRRKKGNPSQ